MKKIIITKNETVYVAKDGKKFSDPKECEVYEIAGKDAMVCPKCDGEGMCSQYKFVGYTHVWATFQEILEECPTCKGKGYLEETR